MKSSLLEEVLEENTLTEKEKKDVKKKIKCVVKKLKEELKKSKIKAEVMLGGSAAKDTFLKDFDVDVFIRFDRRRYLDENISKILAGVVRQFKAKRIHGSRDYFGAKIDGISYEFVPVLNIEDPGQAVNVTDASPLHVNWVLSKLNQRLRNDILLLKLFCKANHCYGAESYIKGFSGHVIDILIIYYDGFERVLRASQHWKPYDIIDVSKHKVRFMNKSKISPLIVVDPIQPDRNAAAALSMERFKLFKERAGAFLEKPSKDFFMRKEFDVEKIKRKFKEDDVFVVNVGARSGKEDVVGAKLLKAFEFIAKRIKKEGFTLKQADWKWNKARKAEFYFVVKREVLPEKMEIEGPPVFVKRHVAAFKKKHKDTFVKKGRLYANVKRPFRKTKKLLQNLIKDTYITEKVKTIELK
ncbi:CCA tRNA nucleotidyltransferase [Candidatus Woesearchaeota archaeon]|nr:MAG: CCA tRNA nucleotidyltransferase [Candidatus Woesearchaeota archaeon]